MYSHDELKELGIESTITGFKPDSITANIEPLQETGEKMTSL